VTHDEELARITDRTIHLKDGIIIDAATEASASSSESSAPTASETSSPNE